MARGEHGSVGEVHTPHHLFKRGDVLEAQIGAKAQHVLIAAACPP